MKNEFSILICRNDYDLRLMSDVLLTIADYKGVLCSDGFDKQLYFAVFLFLQRRNAPPLRTFWRRTKSVLYIPIMILI